LGFEPEFELADRFALHRELDVGVERIDLLAGGVAHEGLPHVLHHACFHQACVKRVAKILKTEVAKAGTTDGGLPSRFDLADRTTLVGEDQSFRLPSSEQELAKSCGKRYFASFSSGCFRVRDKEQRAVKVNVLPPLREQFATAHACIE